MDDGDRAVLERPGEGRVQAMENFGSRYPLDAGGMAEAVLRGVFSESRTGVRATARDGTVALKEE
jgi:hypothetical protein